MKEWDVCSVRDEGIYMYTSLNSGFLLNGKSTAIFSLR
jgi:hypothetical protein